MRKIDVVRVTPEQIRDAVGGVLRFPAVVYAAYDGDRMIGCGGLLWQEGLCWLWLDAVDMEQTHPVLVVRWARRMLQTAWQLGEEMVVTPRDDHPHSKRLLELVGFEQFDMIEEDGQEVELWRCLASKQ